MKVCTRCGVAKPDDAEHYPQRQARTNPVCRVCENLRIRDAQRRSRAARPRDRGEEYAERKRKRAEANPERGLHAIRRRLLKALRCVLRLKRSTCTDTPLHPWLDRKLSVAERYRIRYRLDPTFRVSERLRRQITKRAKRDGVAELLRGALRRGGRSRSAERLLGYSIDELRLHLERQFVKGMGWHNMDRWHIDHIVPQAAFELSNDGEWRACWALTNLRPLWASSNMAKGAQRQSLL